MFITEKRGESMAKEETASSTVAVESIFITEVIAAHDNDKWLYLI